MTSFANSTPVAAQDLSCQGLALVDADGGRPGAGTPTFHGQLVDGYPQEMERRGKAHVFGCEAIGHRAAPQVEQPGEGPAR
ncbi:hypothetical protein ACLQ2R_19590 [Streptosporangium sp. DT93]|uniref:hypothetical protein n=1 Tax=Streptosporangium sp. DT93 TaxID=3393428 RepID=UPI003CF4D97F